MATGRTSPIAGNGSVPEPTLESNTSATSPNETRSSKSKEADTSIPVVSVPLLAEIPDENGIPASCNGHGTLEILEVTKILEANGIPCCMVGDSALIYYGARRGRDVWEICVPTDMIDKASTILQTEPNNQVWKNCPPHGMYETTLHETYPYFKKIGVNLNFFLIPSEDCHLDCSPSQMERSQMGLPYPKLEIFAQSLLDMMEEVDLEDLVDGMNLSEEWGLENLDLDKTNDVNWLRRRKAKVRASVPDPHMFLITTRKSFLLKDIWKQVASIEAKQRRLDPACSKEVYLTRFWTRKSVDPRLRARESV